MKTPSFLKALAVSVFFFLIHSVFSQSIPKISLITFDTGNESHSLFGHTAIRVVTESEDIAYNFGMFDFNTPNFVAKYCTGTLDYWLAKQPYDRILPYYFSENRQVYEQKLNLNEAQTKEIVKVLEKAHQPENKYYRYRFLRNNCSTKVRDILFKEMKGVDYKSQPTGRTFRNYINDYMRPAPWLKFGANLALGKDVDQKIDTYQLMFLPDFLSEEIEKAQIVEKPYVGKTKKTFDNLTPQNTSKWRLTPFIVFSFLFVIMVFTKSNFLIKTFLLIVGVAGTVILVVNLFSEHPEVVNNYNLLWLNPLYLLVFIVSFTTWKRVLYVLSTILVLGILSTLGVWFSKIQGYDFAFFPLLINLLWINFRNMRSSKKQMNENSTT